MAISKVTTLPLISSQHGCFAQGRPEPSLVSLHKHWSCLTTDLHGEMQGEPLQGFFCEETQLMTDYRLWINDEPLRHRFSVQMSENLWSSVGVLPDTADRGNLREGRLPKGSLEVRILRVVDGGWTERIYLKNNGERKAKARLRVELACPIEDNEAQEEKKRDKRSSTHGVRPRLFMRGSELGLRFEKSFGKRRRTPTAVLRKLYGENAPKDGEPVVRALELILRRVPDCPPVGVRVRTGRRVTVTLTAELGAREEAGIDFCFEPIIDGARKAAPRDIHPEPLPRVTSDLPAEAPRIASGNSTFNYIMAQAVADLQSLRLPVAERKSGSAAPEGKLDAYAAGIPRYIGVFGRDTLITAWQSALVDTATLEQALARLSRLKGIERDPWRDEEKNRLLHERRLNPCSAIGKMNRSLYYGDVASTPLWVIGLSNLHAWQGDPDRVRGHLETLSSCLDWILWRLEQGKGFIYYQPALPRSKDANRNQAWKDSGDAIVDESGRIRVPPLALPEIQGYAYQALHGGACLLEALGQAGRARELVAHAEELKRRFNEAFWMQDRQFYALALGRGERQVKAIASNIGHCLGTGILREDRVEPVVRKLMSEELFSGWGIRTLSSDNPGFDPFSYHRGAVWPVEAAIIAQGMQLRGYHREATELVCAQLALASLFQHFRLPEVISGNARTPTCPTPGVYPYANPLQAWSASAMVLTLQLLLGIYPDAPHDRLHVDPHLPEWLPWLELRGLRVNRGMVDIRFWRDDRGESRWEVLRLEGRLSVDRKASEFRTITPTGQVA